MSHNNNKTDFKKWLSKKNLSYEDFSHKTGIRYNTVVKWTCGVKPRQTSNILIKRKFPDCPLLKGHE